MAMKFFKARLQNDGYGKRLKGRELDDLVEALRYELGQADSVVNGALFSRVIPNGGAYIGEKGIESWIYHVNSKGKVATIDERNACCAASMIALNPKLVHTLYYKKALTKLPPEQRDEFTAIATSMVAARKAKDSDRLISEEGRLAAFILRTGFKLFPKLK
jgi:hypothetical protein